MSAIPTVVPHAEHEAEAEQEPLMSGVPLIVKDLGVSGASVGIATMATNPIDVVKVHMQMQASGDAARRGMLGTAAHLVRTEGWSSFTGGMMPAVARAVFYGGIRLGLYSPLKAAAAGESGEVTFGGKVVAGCTSGAVAAAMSNPMDLVKTRMQLDTTGAGVGTIARNVVSEGGVAALWRGSVAGSSRAAILTASQCASYDEIKKVVLGATGWADDFRTHFTASMATGVITTTCISPADIVKTRMYSAAGGSASPFEVLGSIVRSEGPIGLFKGWTANYVRMGPQTMITFVVVEKLRSWAGMESL